jgi:MSHA biogenesis protein MshO
MKKITQCAVQIHKNIRGFTLIELVLVIIILGIMSAGISGFITLSAQTYLNATNRDELLGNARFVIERLNRELRNAVPNSVWIETSSSQKKQCVIFVPIIASTVYTDIPVAPKPASKELSVIEFEMGNGEPYEPDLVDGFDDVVMVYPLNKDDVYDDSGDTTGKVFAIDSLDKSQALWKINLSGDATFDEDSPTRRLFIADRQVEYCVAFGEVRRYRTRIGNSSSGRKYLMGEYAIENLVGNLPFTYLPGTLTRNSVVQINLNFTRNGESYGFDHEVHMNNVP